MSGRPPGQRWIMIPCCEVERIREHYASGAYTQQQLAGLWGCTSQNIHAITSGKSRKNCGGPITHSRPGQKPWPRTESES